MKIYDAPFSGTRGSRLRLMLEELGVSYELSAVNLRHGEHKRAEYLKIHPHGLVPAFELDGVSLIESAAVCMQLADLNPEAGLAPPVGSAARALYYQWIVYGPATLDDQLVARVFNTAFLPEEKRDPAVVAKADRVWAAAAPFLSRALETHPWLCGEQFTAADVVIGYDIQLANAQGLLADYPVLQGYLDRLTARPAWQRVYTR